MSAFVIAQVTVKDPERFQQYAAAVPATVAPFGGELLLRGAVAEVLAGEFHHQTSGVLTFPDRDSAVRWYNSPDYQALIENREAAADMNIVIFEAPPA